MPLTGGCPDRSQTPWMELWDSDPKCQHCLRNKRPAARLESPRAAVLQAGPGAREGFDWRPLPGMPSDPGSRPALTRDPEPHRAQPPLCSEEPAPTSGDLLTWTSFPVSGVHVVNSTNPC